MKILYLITGRAGSKGLPGKNTKLLGGKPLVTYSIAFALKNLKGDDELCISTNDQGIISIAEKMGVKVPFIRPEALSSDSASSHDVIMHALNFYEKQGLHFDAILLLQPTSPFRSQDDLNQLVAKYDESIDMVVSVKHSKENPYFTLFEEDNQGLLKKSKEGVFKTRQECPQVFSFNGSMYLINVNSVKQSTIAEFKNIRKIIMPEERSVDIDTLADWKMAEFYLHFND